MASSVGGGVRGDFSHGESLGYDWGSNRVEPLLAEMVGDGDGEVQAEAAAVVVLTSVMVRSSKVAAVKAVEMTIGTIVVTMARPTMAELVAASTGTAAVDGAL